MDGIAPGVWKAGRRRHGWPGQPRARVGQPAAIGDGLLRRFQPCGAWDVGWARCGRPAFRSDSGELAG